MTNRLAQALAASIRETIDPSLPRIDSRQSGGETTHLSVMDVEGNAVGITQSIELVYGSKAAADGLGFLYNNYMDSLDLNNPAHPFYLRPNASPWTSVAPALVFHNDALWMVTGSPGSERIYSAISQFLVHMIDANLSMAEAVEQPRLHCSIGGKLSIEADRFAPDIPGYSRRHGVLARSARTLRFLSGGDSRCAEVPDPNRLSRCGRGAAGWDSRRIVAFHTRHTREVLCGSSQKRSGGRESGLLHPQSTGRGAVVPHLFPVLLLSLATGGASAHAAAANTKFRFHGRDCRASPQLLHQSNGQLILDSFDSSDLLDFRR